MKKVFVFALLLSAVNLFAQTDTTKFQTLKKADWQVKYPANWTVADTSLPDMNLDITKLTITESAENGKPPMVISFLKQDLSAQPMSMEEFKEVSEGQISSFLEEPTVEKSEIKDDRFTFIYNGKQQGTPIYLLQVVINKGTDFILLTFPSKDKEAFDKYKSIALTVASTFRTI